MKLLPLSLVLLLLAVVLHGATSTSDNDNNHDVSVDMLNEGDILDEGFFDQEYFHDMSENDRRKLQDFPAYKTPKWWGRYKKMFGRKYIRRCNKWIIDHMEPPRSGSLYCPKFSGNYTCFFGEQKCEENGRRPQNHPDKQCTCVDKEWRCKDWSCPDPFFYTCPKTYEQLENSNNKCLGNMKCEYDDNKECECVNGEFLCKISVLPQVSGLTKCPADYDEMSSAGCAVDLSCKFGTETCCGETFSSLQCRCSAGDQFPACFHTDACLSAPLRCPDQYPGYNDPISISQTVPAPDADPSDPVKDVAKDPPQDPTQDVVDTPDDTIDFIDLFPAPTPPPEQGQVCTVDGEELEIGEDCRCCGKCVPDWRCKCNGGTYACRKTFGPGMVCACAAPLPVDLGVAQP